MPGRPLPHHRAGRLRPFRRAGLDYLDHAEIVRHGSYAAFEDWRRREDRRLVLLTTQGDTSHLDFAFRDRDVLMLGRETEGVPRPVHDAAAARLRIPMRPSLRSLNVAVAAAIALGEALRQTRGFPDGG